MSEISPVPFFDLGRVLAPLRGELHAALDRCLGHGTFVLGPEVVGFEAKLAAWLRIPHVVGVSSGTDALLATLQALQLEGGDWRPLEPGDEVLTTPFSFISSATSVLRAGLRPVFADLAPGTFHPGLAELERAVTPRTKAVLVVHLFGEPLDIAAIAEWCRHRSLLLVEDCAQAIGAQQPDGTSVGFAGMAGCFSFFPAKNLGTLGDGGAVATTSEILAAKIREQRQHGQAVRYQFDHLGGNFRLDALQAAFLSTLLPHLHGFLAERRRNAERYQQALGPLAHARPDLLTLPPDRPGHAWNQFVVRSEDRTHLRQALLQAGVSTQIYYPSALHQQGALRAANPPESLPLAEHACRTVLALPVAPGMSEAEQERVIAAILCAW